MLVKCYFNVQKKVFSVSRKGDRVEHFNSVLLRNCTFHVSQKGRERVLREKKKNVHATIRGEIIDGSKVGEKESSLFHILSAQTHNFYKIRYNPYLYHYFFVDQSLIPIYEADYMLLTDKTAWCIPSAYALDTIAGVNYAYVEKATRVL